jgi:membrane protein EpsK
MLTVDYVRREYSVAGLPQMCLYLNSKETRISSGPRNLMDRMSLETPPLATERTSIGGTSQHFSMPIAPRGNTLRNALVRFGAQVLAIFINLLVTPYIVDHLGVESYGIVGVINTLISFVAIATTSVTSAVGRDLTFAIERGEYENANTQISTAVFGLALLLAIVLLPLCALSILIDRLIVIPPELTAGARVFWILTVFSFCFTSMSGPHGAGMFVRNRLDLLSAALFARTVFYVAMVLVLFSAVDASLTSYGFAVLAGSVLLYFISVRLNKQMLPGIEISTRWFDHRALRSIMSIGGWMTLNQIGALLFLQTDLMIANRVLGPVASGQLAAISVIPLQLRVLAGLVSGLFAPNQAALVARGGNSNFLTYLLRCIRLTSLFFALLVGVFCGSAHEVLRLWLGKGFAQLTPIALVLTFYLVISLGIAPTSEAVLMLGKVKIPALVTLGLGVGNVILGIFLARNMGLMGIAFAGCTTLLLRNALFIPLYVSRVCHTRPWSFWRELLIGSTCCAAISTITVGVVSLLKPGSLGTLALSISLSSGLGFLLLLPIASSALKRTPE